MRKWFSRSNPLLYGAIAILIMVPVFLFPSRQVQAAVTCQPTGFMKDSLNLTAAQIVTTSASILSKTIDATGCNIGVYFAPGSSGFISSSEISGANYYGVLNNGGNVTVLESHIHNIGENPFNGAQHGVDLEFFSSGGTIAGGSIIGNLFEKYQKGGIDLLGSGTSANVLTNTVTGLGPVSFTAQNGIEVGEDAQASLTGNTVSGNSYTGTGGVASGGILVFGGMLCYGSALTTGTAITGNTLSGNDVGVFLSNLADVASCTQPATTPTNIAVTSNAISNTSVNNTSGTNLSGQPGGYQAGVSDQGDSDRITGNRICGLGYTPVVTPPPYLFMIDVTNTITPSVSGNTTSPTC